MDKANINSLDLIEQRDKVFEDMNKVIDILEKSPCFPSLLWAWTFDILRNTFENNQWEDVHEDSFTDEAIPQGVTLKQIFDKFWDDVDSLGLEMDHGGEILEETILDWMRENDFLLPLEDDGWLDD